VFPLGKKLEKWFTFRALRLGTVCGAEKGGKLGPLARFSSRKIVEQIVFLLIELLSVWAALFG